MQQQRPRLSAALEEVMERGREGGRERDEINSCIAGRGSGMSALGSQCIYYDCMRGYEHEHPHPPVTHCSFSASHDSLEALGLFPAFVGVTRVSVFLTFCASPDTHASAVQSGKTAALGFCT